MIVDAGYYSNGKYISDEMYFYFGLSEQEKQKILEEEAKIELEQEKERMVSLDGYEEYLYISESAA